MGDICKCKQYILDSSQLNLSQTLPSDMLNFLGVVLISCAIGQNNAAEFLMYADKKINARIIEVNIENILLLNHENVCSIKGSHFFSFFNFFQLKIVAVDFLDFLNIKAF